jgi:hypothetical protein
MKLRGYRGDDRALLTGRWPAGELLGLPMANWPALAEPTTVEPPAGPGEELCVVAGVAFVRYTELDWVHRRARLEIGVAHERHADAVDLLVKLAVTHGFVSLNLRRLYGFVTPAARPGTPALESAGFLREASVPDGGWLDGGPVEREIWGAVRHD